MNEKLLKLLKKIVIDIAGPGSEKLVDLLYKKNNVNEFQIAKKLGGTINQTRNILYKLADKGLVEFLRKKDKKKGGWYIYYWTLKTKRILQSHKESLAKQIQNLEEQLHQRETDRYFYCPNCGAEYDEETAMLHEFTCPECGEVLQMKDMSEISEQIKKEREKLENTIAELDQEIQLIEVKEQKAQARKLKAEAKKLAIKKKAERKKKERMKKKEMKKINKIFMKKKTRKKFKKKIKKKFKKKIKRHSKKR